MKIGVISDTHGLLRPEVAPALAGVERILHLGDVGKPSILNDLGKIAPVTAIRGNIDREGPCSELPETEVLLLGGRYVYMLHDLNTLHLDPAAGKFAAVLHGHSHVPNFYKRKGVLYFSRS
jgi:putative phosphoesterase